MNSKFKPELDRIAAERGGLLYPADVVEAAADESSPLHSWFEWDDTEAAHRFRLEQARKLIRVYVETIPANGGKSVRAFVNLSTDRQSDGGYRVLADVLSNAELYAVMLSDALAELERMSEKYEAIKELKPVFRAAAKVKKPRTAKRAA